MAEEKRAGFWRLWKENLYWHRWRYLTLFIFLGAFLALDVLAGWYGQDLYARLVASIGLAKLRIGVGLSIYFVGLAGAIFKRKRQYIYGQLEVSFGLASGGFIADQLPAHDVSMPQLFGLIACVYVIIRGIGNMNDAHLDSRPFRAYPNGPS